MNMALGMWGSNVLHLATTRTHGGSWVMSASALLASTIVATFGLAGLAFVASRRGLSGLGRVFGSGRLAVYRPQLFDLALVITAETKYFQNNSGQDEFFGTPTN